MFVIVLNSCLPQVGGRWPNRLWKWPDCLFFRSLLIRFAQFLYLTFWQYDHLGPLFIIFIWRFLFTKKLVRRGSICSRNGPAFFPQNMLIRISKGFVDCSFWLQTETKCIVGKCTQNDPGLVLCIIYSRIIFLNEGREQWVIAVYLC